MSHESIIYLGAFALCATTAVGIWLYLDRKL